MWGRCRLSTLQARNRKGTRARMSSRARTDVGGRGAASVPGNVEVLRSAYEAFNEVVRTEGDLPGFVRTYLNPHAEYRPIEEPEWFSDPEAITRSMARWIERAEGDPRARRRRCLVAVRHVGSGRGRGVPIEAVIYHAVTMCDAQFSVARRVLGQGGSAGCAGRARRRGTARHLLGAQFTTVQVAYSTIGCPTGDTPRRKPLLGSNDKLLRTGSRTASRWAESYSRHRSARAR